MKPFAALALAVILVSNASAQRQVFAINADASQVKMTLKTTHEVVHGEFHVQSGSIEFDHNAPAMTGSVIVLAGSGKTGNGTRDKRMNKEILQVEQHTTVSFSPRSYTGTIASVGDSTIQVSGTFTLLDKPHEITIPMLVHLAGATATATAHFSIPYTQWGLKDPSILFWRADKEVAIDLFLSGQLLKRPTV
ncbi:MAG TPA: YceI family protein [Acidobacteriaceae bacterium]|jgi:polyisoprenoid-binding protein YceI